MPRKKQSKEQVEEMQNQILDATELLLDEIQPEEISIRRIAEKVGVSHMAIYTYFRDRDDLLQALISRQEERLSRRFEKVLQSSRSEDFIFNLKGALRDYMNQAKAKPRLFKLLWALPIKKENGFSSKVNLEDQMNPLINYVKDGQQKDVFQKKDPRLVAMTLLSILNAPLFLCHLGRLSDAKLRDRLIDESLEVAMEYITAKTI